MELRLVRLGEVDPQDVIRLMRDPRVRRHMPLSGDEFGPAECAAFVAAKDALWREHGYGPWAFLLDGVFAGWGGLQPEDGDADLALVLHPDFWGHGRMIADRILTEAFGPMGLDSVVVALPPTRGSAAAVIRRGFHRDGELTIAGRRFLRYRLRRPS
jgi:ribosomal-protein-alanine N-acetyltransferase